MEATRPDLHIFPRFWRVTTLEVVLFGIATACIGFAAALSLLRDDGDLGSFAWSAGAAVLVAIGCMRRVWRRRQPGDRVFDD